MQDNGVACGLKNYKILHGSSIRYCNLTHVHSMLKNRMAGQPFDVDAVPMEADLREADSRAGPNTLMQMMYTGVCLGGLQWGGEATKNSNCRSGNSNYKN